MKNLPRPAISLSCLAVIVGSIAVAPASAEAGDFDTDGRVDGLDVVAWNDSPSSGDNAAPTLLNNIVADFEDSDPAAYPQVPLGWRAVSLQWD